MDEPSALMQQFEQYKILGREICQQMVGEVEKMGFVMDEIKQLPDFDSARFCLTKDPYTAVENLTGDWFDGQKQRIGKIQFLSDGSFYAEYDIVQPHPKKQQWFVEAVTAWGREGQIKTEPKLLPAME